MPRSTVHPDPEDPLVGRTLRGKYLVQKRIGSGGMGVVYRCLHVGLDRVVALKVLRRGVHPDPVTVERFHAEARRTSRLRHPHIVAVTDFGEAEDGTLFMAMEHIPGKTLARVIADEAPLPERRVIRIGAQILAAVAEAHAQRILHRDLNPSNVMIEPCRRAAEVAKVLDFGIARIEEPAGGLKMTAARAIWGTPGYMSPEQSSGAALDARSDLYSVGVVLHEMLTGELPTPSGGHAPEQAPRQSARVSIRLTQLVSGALSPSPGARPSTAVAMREELLAALCEPCGEGPRQADGPFDPAILEKARRELAVHLGPLAAFIVDRVSSRAKDVDQLYELLALEQPGRSSE
jgi:eukaryotic-like serine/threonine-protein kinase